MRLNRIIAFVMAFLLLSMSISFAADTTLSVRLFGMKRQADGQWSSEIIDGTFDVYQSGTQIGILTANSLSNEPLALQGNAEITLLPDLSTLTEGYTMDAQGYSLAVTEGIDNMVPILAYANEGFFVVHADANRELSYRAIVDDDDANDTEDAIFFSTDEEGQYTQETLIPAGDYLLQSPDDPSFQYLFTITAFRGSEHEITVIDLTDIVWETPLDEEEIVPPEDEITEEPETIKEETVLSDETPDEIPEAIEEDAVLTHETSEEIPEDTEADTDEVAEEEAEIALPELETDTAPAQEVSWHIKIHTDEKTQDSTDVVILTLYQGDALVDRWTMPLMQDIIIDQVSEEGTYLFRMLVPDGMYVRTTSVPEEGNGRLETFTLDVTEGFEATISLDRYLSVTGMVEAEEASVSLEINDETTAVPLEEQQFTFQGIKPGFYTVHVELSSADYEGEGWAIQESEEGIRAIYPLMLGNTETTVTLPPLLKVVPSEETLETISETPVLDETAQPVEPEVTPEPLEEAEAPVAVQEIVEEQSDEPVETPVEEPEEEVSEDAWLPVDEDEILDELSFTEDVPVEEPVEDVPETTEEPVVVVETILSEPKNASSNLLSPDRERSELPLRNLPYKLVEGNAALEVMVFSDTNHNGEKGKYEVPLSGVVVELILTEAVGDTIVAYATTDDTGLVRFENLPEGDYIVRTQLPAYYSYGEKGKTANSLTSSGMQRQSAANQESAPFHISEGTEVRFGVGATPSAGIRGQVWVDVNADGVRQSDEPGQAGVLIEMIGLKNGLTYQVVTGEDGYYSFTQLRLGSYRIRVTLPDGMMFTKYSKTGGDNRSIFTDEGKTVAAKNYDMNKAHVEEEQNIGVYGEAGISGRAFLDANYSGVYDEGDLPLSGVKVVVYRQSTNVELTTVTTDSEGFYTIPALRPGAYRVRAILPDTGIFFTKVNSDTQANRFKRVAGRRESSIENVTLGLNEVRSIYIGAVQPSTIAGTVYMDHDFNGIMDAGEVGVSGVTVTLLDQDGTVLDTVRTNKDGKFLFEEVVPGTHQLAMQAPDGYAFTRLAQDNCLISRGGGYGSTEMFFVSLNSTVTGMNAGLVLPGTVRGAMFADLNDNGGQEENEPGLDGALVRLVSDDGNQYETVIGPDATYVFDAVLPGNYTAEITLPENTVFTHTGDWQVNGSTANFGTFGFMSGEERTLSALGAIRFGSISGLVFENPAADGMYLDGVTTPMAGATIRLAPESAKGEVQTLTTGPDGLFQIDSLRPGSYRLTLTLPDGYVLARTSACTLPLENCHQEQTVLLQLNMGDTYLGEHLGAVIPGSLEGFVWLDANEDGVYRYDADILPAGEEIHVISLDDEQEILTLRTDREGRFETDGLIPGNYRLVYVLNGSTMALSGAGDFVEEDGMLVMEPVVVRSGTRTEGISLGLLRLTTIAGSVWLDQQGEILPLEGAQITLYNVASGSVEETVITPETGDYQFAGLMPGAYQLSVTLPEGQIVAESSDERLTRQGLISVMSFCQGRKGESDVFTLTMGSDLLDMNIGSVLPGSLGDLVWLDENQNGLMDTDESGLSGIVLHLYRAGTEVAQTVTDAYGFYRFEDLYPAIYTIKADLPAEVRPTLQRTDFIGIVSMLGENGFTSEVQVISNASNDVADMGVVLVTPGVYPQGYRQGATQDWSGTITPDY